jgi:uncharacterized membrane protein
LTVLLFTVLDIIIDPVALRGDRWFLGRIYYYPDPGIHFGVPLGNYVGWAVVGLITLTIYFTMDRRLSSPSQRGDQSVTGKILLGSGLYYAVVIFNLMMAFWINEPLIGLAGIFIYLPITALAILRLGNQLPPALNR